MHPLVFIKIKGLNTFPQNQMSPRTRALTRVDSPLVRKYPIDMNHEIIHNNVP